MGVVLPFNGRNAALPLPLPTPYELGESAAEEFYSHELSDAMTDAWLENHRYVIQTYPCPPEDPLFRQMQNEEFRSGIADRLVEIFNRHVWVAAPTERQPQVVVAVFRSRFLLWSVSSVYRLLTL